MKLFIFFLVVMVLTNVVRTVYEIMKTRNRINPEGRGVFVVIFTSMVILWISWFSLCASDPGIWPLPPVLKLPGAALFLVGFVLFGWSLGMVKKFENYHGELITSGIYRYLRHPMYLGFICWLAGSALFSLSGMALLLAVPVTCNILVWKRLEEIQLKKVYPEYANYIKRTLF